jgi:hypothetical protein
MVDPRGTTHITSNLRHDRGAITGSSFVDIASEALVLLRVDYYHRIIGV